MIGSEDPVKAALTPDQSMYRIRPHELVQSGPDIEFQGWRGLRSEAKMQEEYFWWLFEIPDGGPRSNPPLCAASGSADFKFCQHEVRHRTAQYESGGIRVIGIISKKNKSVLDLKNIVDISIGSVGLNA